ncbi:hypothetical protein AB7X03_10870 [Providencia rettgeri]
MTYHLLLPNINITNDFIHDKYKEYLLNWRESVMNAADDGILSSAECLQAVLIELSMNGRITHDWLTIMNELLVENHNFIAYSRGYGKLLYGFDKQFFQSTIHSIHTRWWIENLMEPQHIDYDKFAQLILSKKQKNELIYDFDVSETTLRHRMKSELTLSAAMSSELLLKAGKLTDSLKNKLSASISDLTKIPLDGYILNEQFRLTALKFLSHEEQLPLGISEYIDACENNLEFGWNDFPIDSKVDAYMGTAKRTSRDSAIHSPLVACHVSALSDVVDKNDRKKHRNTRLANYADYLSQKPLNIPAYHMRDILIPFGVGITPIEAICASWLIKNSSKQVQNV